VEILQIFFRQVRPLVLLLVLNRQIWASVVRLAHQPPVSISFKRHHSRTSLTQLEHLELHPSWECQWLAVLGQVLQVARFQ
jgi:hypothetical protein